MKNQSKVFYNHYIHLSNGRMIRHTSSKGFMKWSGEFVIVKAGLKSHMINVSHIVEVVSTVKETE